MKAVHYIFDTKRENGLLTFPGALFPNNFAEMEKYKGGGFFIVDDELNFEYIEIKLKDVVNFEVDANDKTAEEVQNEIDKLGVKFIYYQTVSLGDPYGDYYVKGFEKDWDEEKFIKAISLVSKYTKTVHKLIEKHNLL